jgi:hypothetical protein
VAAFHARQTEAQAMAPGTTIVHFDTVDEDTAGAWQGPVFAYQAPVAGEYAVAFGFGLAGTPVSAAVIRVNGVNVRDGAYNDAVAAGMQAGGSVAAILELALNDLVTCCVLNADAAAHNTLVGPGVTYVDIAQVPTLDSGSLLGLKVFNDGAGRTTNSAVLVDADAANLAVAFVAPPSGNVLVELQTSASSSVAGNYYWGLREGGAIILPQGTDASGRIYVADDVDGAGGGRARVTAFLYVTGLAPGSAHVYKWAHAVSGGVGAMGEEGARDPWVMRVTAA